MEYNYGVNIISQYYKDPVTGTPISKKTTEKQVINSLKNIVQLIGEPDEFNRVKVKITDIDNMIEVFNFEDIKFENQYYVDYSTSLIYFHPNYAGRYVEVEYDDKGLTLIGYGRVFTKLDEQGNVVETLQTIIDKGYEAILVLHELGNANQILQILRDTIQEARDVDTHLQGTISEAIATEKTINNYSKAIQLNDWTLETSGEYAGFYSCNINHGLNSTNLLTQFWSESVESTLTAQRIVDSNNLKIINNVAIGGKLVCNKSYYSQSGIVDLATFNTSQLPQTFDFRYVNDKELADVRDIPNKISKEEFKNTSKQKTSLVDLRNSDYAEINDDIYSFTDLELASGVTQYYSNVAFGQAKIDKYGVVKFRGVINALNVVISSNEAIIGKLPFYYISNYDGSQRGGFVTCSTAGYDKVFSIKLRPDGNVSINISESDRNYLKYINLNGTSIETWLYSRENINTYIDSKVNDLIYRRSRTNYMFPFMPDIHNNIFNKRRYNNLDIVNHLDSILDFECYMSGGDNIVEPFNINSNCTKKQALLAHKQLMSRVPKEKFIWVKGNHDDNHAQNYPNNQYSVIRPSDLMPIINNENIVYGDGYYGYMDNEESKVRVVFIDSYEKDYNIHPVNGIKNITLKQLHFICGQALNFEDKENKPEWHTIFVSHIPPLVDTDGVNGFDGEMPYANVLLNIIKGFKDGTQCLLEDALYRFDLQGAMPVIGYFYGHYHKEQNQVKEGINFVNSTLFQNVSADLKKVIGTVEEFAFDVVSVDKTNRMVYLDRIGAGSSRKFSY